MKKVTVELRPCGINANGFDLTHRGQNVGRLCRGVTMRILGICDNRSYRLEIRQTKTRTDTTSILLIPPCPGITHIWHWLSNISELNEQHVNVFLFTITDRFLSRTFGHLNDRVFLRIKVKKIS